MDEIRTRRLSWRPGGPEHLAAYWALLSDHAVVRMLGTWPWPPDRADTESRMAPVDPARGFVGPVFAAGEMVGSCGVIEAELSLAFGPAHWGKGYATEIGAACLARAFTAYDWPAITASCWADNPASAAVLLKLGFAETGQGRDYCRGREAELDDRRFALSRAEWEARDGH